MSPKYSHYAVFLVCLAFFVSGCANNNYQIVETNNLPEVTTQIVSLNNCLGTAEAEQTISRERRANIEGTGNLGVDIQAAKASVEAKYSEGSSATTSQKLIAPPGTNMEFELEWKERSWVGIIKNQFNQDIGRYVARIPVEVRLVKSEDLECKTADGKIDFVDIEHNVFLDNEYGMLIHIQFSVTNRKHMPVSLVGYFSYANGAKLLDTNNNYRAGDGQVSISRGNILPEHKSSSIKLDIFMPYSELDIYSCQGMTQLYVVFELHDDVEKTFVAESEKSYFEFGCEPTETPIPPIIENNTCNNLPESVLSVGVEAFVSLDPPNPNTVREKPGGKALGKIPAGGIVTILDGPICQNGLRWWLVSSSEIGLTGWTPDSDTKAYWLIPK